VLRPPLPGPIRAVTVNGRPLKEFGAEEAKLRTLPATVRLAFEAGTAEA